MKKLAERPSQFVAIKRAGLGPVIEKLRPEEREAVLLTCEEHFSYRQAAQMCGCSEGTIKSRVHRGRTRLAVLLAIGALDRDEADFVASAAIANENAGTSYARAC